MPSVLHSKSISFSQAIKTVQQAASSLQLSVELLDLGDALGRVISTAITAPINVPEFDCSRMDGFAVNTDYLQDSKGIGIKVASPIYAGEYESIATDIELLKTLATPVMTGSVLPLGANAVVMKEHATLDGDEFKVNQVVHRRQNIRAAGSDVKKGQVVLKKNHVISSADLGLLSSLGLSQVSVYKKPKVALLMTGDELVVPGDVCKKGQVFDSNSLMLTKLLEQIGCQVSLFKTLKDNLVLIEQQFKSWLSDDFDLIVTVGGVSMGDKDWLPLALATYGQIIFHKTHIKPGFPLLFGQMGRAVFFGLPGNPVSAFTTLFQFVYPAVLCLNQLSKKSPLVWRAELLQDFSKKHMKREFVRGRYSMTSEGTVEVSVCGGQQSSRIQSLSEANCFIVFNESQQDVRQGERVSIQPFNQLSYLGD